MKKIIALGVLAAATMAGSAISSYAADDVMSVYYGNTLFTQNQPRYVVSTWLNQDKSFKQFKAWLDNGAPHAAGWEGTWAMMGNTVCLTYAKTPVPNSVPAPNQGSCMPVAAHKVGDVWRVTVADGPNKGQTETVTIRQGHNSAP